jgi:hypothetical protein
MLKQEQVRSCQPRRETKLFRFDKARFNYLVDNGQIVPFTQEQKDQHKTQRFLARRGKGCSSTKGHVRELFGYLTMTDGQKERFIEYVKSGLGKAFSCLEVGVTWNVYLRTRKEDAEFAAKVDLAFASVDDLLDGIIHADAFENKSVASALALRRLRLDAATRKNSITMERKKLEIEKSKLVLKEREVSSKVKLSDHIVESSLSPNGMRSLTNEEFSDYTSIWDRLKRGEIVSPEESMKFAELTAKVAAPPIQNGHSNGVAAIENMNRVDNLFDDEEEE